MKYLLLMLSFVFILPSSSTFDEVNKINDIQIIEAKNFSLNNSDQVCEIKCTQDSTTEEIEPNKYVVAFIYLMGIGLIISLLVYFKTRKEDDLSIFSDEFWCTPLIIRHKK